MAEIAAKRDRSPNFPSIPLKAALERLASFEKYFSRHPAPANKAGLAWEMKENSDQATQILAAMRYFGLIEYQGVSPHREAVITDAGRTYLRAQQDSIKQQIIRDAALKPQMIRKFWDRWGPTRRPPDPMCIDELILRNGFSDRGAPAFLKVYDATLAFAGLEQSDSLDPDLEVSEIGDDRGVATETKPSAALVSRTPLPPARGIAMMEGERELTTGMLSRDANFRLIVRGPIGVKEIDLLIRKLQLDKEILADETATEPDGKDTSQRERVRL